MENILNKLFSISLLMVILGGCTDPKIDETKNEPDPSPGQHADYQVNQWIYKIMKSDYLWAADVANIKTINFEQNYDKFFQSLLKVPVRNFADGAAHDGRSTSNLNYVYSYIERAAKSKGITRSASGKNSFGFEFYLLNPANSDNVYALITYVVPGSPAEGQLTRQDWIGKIDGVQMTFSNAISMYSMLLPSDQARTLKLTTFRVNDQNILVESKTPISLTSKTVDDNPVHKQDIIELDEGSKRVGYLVYNAFEDAPEGSNNDAYIVSLKNAFTYFKAGNVTHLVLDLRYNPGGYVHVCTILSSMIGSPTMAGTTFAQCEPNPNRAKWFEKFKSTTQLSAFGAGEGAYLDMKEIYVLTSESTASASEMVINGLRGVGITVHQIGTTTEGKNVGSELYNQHYGGKLAGGTYGDFQYSIRPITFQIFNAKHESNYANGFTPDYEIEDASISSLRKELGDQQETLLKVALTHISTGRYPEPIPRAAATKSSARDINISSIDFKPVRGLIYVPGKE